MKKYKIAILIVIFLAIVLPLAIKAFWFDKRELQLPAAKEIILIDNGHRFIILSRANTVEDFLAEHNINLKEEDLIFPSQGAELLPKMNIEIKRSVKAKIHVDGQEIETDTLSRTVAGALKDASVAVSHLDIVKPVEKAALYEGIEIEITRIEIEEITKEEIIEYKTVEEEDDDLKWRKEKVVQVGENGIKEVDYRLKYRNGKLAEKTKLASRVVKEPIKEIIAIGTKIEVGKTKTGVASWYSHEGGMFCASRMFPRGTWLRVTNKENGKQVFVQVNDYGPMRGTGKMIDLDKPAFNAIANLGQGVVEVKVEEILD